MRVKVYTPATLTIRDKDIPKLAAKARKRRRLPESKKVPTRLLVEEARRAGLIKLGRDYCIHINDDEINRRARRSGRGRSRAASRQ